MPAIARRRLLIALIAAAVGLATLGTAQPYGSGETTTPIELRVWQGLDAPTDIAVGARAPDGVWGELGMVPLTLDGLTASGRYRYGQTTLQVPLTDFAPVGVEVRVWQAARVPRVIYVSARGVGGSWDLLGTFRFRLEHGVRPDLGYRFGDMRIEVELPEPQVVTLAGRAGEQGSADGVGDDARFRGSSAPWDLGLDVDAEGNVIVADYSNAAIRRIAPDGTVTTIAGGNGHGVRDGPAEVAQFANPTDVAVAPDGAIYVAQYLNNHIRKITPDGMVTTLVGDGSLAWNRVPSSIRDGHVEDAVFYRIRAIELAPDGDLYIMEPYGIRRLSPSGWVTTVAGAGVVGFVDGPGRRARFHSLRDIALDAAGNLYVIDSNDRVPAPGDQFETIRKIDANGIVSTLFVGDPSQAGGPLASPEGIAVSASGEIYISNTGRNQIVRLTSEGELRAVVGSGDAGFRDGPYSGAKFREPGALAFAPNGALIVADQVGTVVRAILPDGDGFGPGVPLVDVEVLPRVEGVQVTRFAGRPGASSYRGDGDPAAQAHLSGVRGIAIDQAGNVFVADTLNDAIRRISTDGTISTLAGGNGYGTRDGPADRAQFERPVRVAVDTEGNVFVSEAFNSPLRRIGADGTVSTLDGQLGNFRPMAAHPDGSLLIARSGSIVRRAPDGTISTVTTGSGTVCALTVDHDGAVYFAVNLSNAAVIKTLTPAGDIVTLFEGRAAGRYGGPVSPCITGIAVTPDGSLYLADRDLGRVTRIDTSGAAAVVADHEDFDARTNTWPTGIVVTPEGDLIVSDRWQHVIWKITIDEDGR